MAPSWASCSSGCPRSAAGRSSRVESRNQRSAEPSAAPGNTERAVRAAGAGCRRIPPHPAPNTSAVPTATRGAPYLVIVGAQVAAQQADGRARCPRHVPSVWPLPPHPGRLRAPLPGPSSRPAGEEPSCSGSPCPPPAHPQGRARPASLQDSGAAASSLPSVPVLSTYI